MFMKRITKSLLILLPLILGSCLPNKDKTSSSITSTSTSTDVPSSSEQTGQSDTDTSEDDPDEPEIDKSKFEKITLSDHEVDLKVGKSLSLFVNYFPKEGEVISDEDKEVSWTTSASSIASVSQYGVVKALNNGKALITCTTKDGYRRATCIVYVYTNESEITKEWQKVTSEESLEAGDLIVIACPQENKTATKENTGMYLHSTSSTFSSSGDKITTLGSESEQFVLDGNKDNWTFENADGDYLATTHVGKVTFIHKTGNIHWQIDYSNGYCDLRSSSSIDGWFMYNAQHDKFTTYESNEQFDMFVVTLYKQVRIHN